MKYFKKILPLYIIFLILGSFGLSFISEIEAMFAWWLVSFLLMPPLLFALNMRFVSPKVICAISFAAQFFTVPYFYLNKKDFLFSDVKPYGFTAPDAIPILLKVSVFLFMFVFLFGFLYKLNIIGGSMALVKIRDNIDERCSERKLFSNRYKNISNLIYPVVLISIPINIWMFTNGINIVGIEPPFLPYKLAGILHYIFKFAIPALLAYLYWKSQRGWLLVIFIIIYAWVLGMSSVSRSSFLYVMLPIMLFAILDKRYAIFSVAFINAIIGYAFVTLARSFVYITTNGVASGDFSNSIFSIFNSIVFDVENSPFTINFLANALVSVFIRMDGFESLVMSQFYDANKVNGPMAIILNTISYNLAPIDIDLHHIQWQNETLPSGFVAGGAIQASAVVLGSISLFWIYLLSLICSIIFIILEKRTKKMLSKYKLPMSLSIPIIGFLCLIFTVGDAGSIVFNFPFVTIVILSILPPLIRLKQR